MPTLTMSVPVSSECLCFILCTIFEQGVGYWVESATADGAEWREQARADEGLDSLFRSSLPAYCAPAYGGSLTIRTNEEAGAEVYTLTQDSLLAGIARAAGEGRFSVSEDMAGDIDCDIADVILQYAIMGEITFG
jgi:hypothetical protein